MNTAELIFTVKELFYCWDSKLFFLTTLYINLKRMHIWDAWLKVPISVLFLQKVSNNAEEVFVIYRIKSRELT